MVENTERVRWYHVVSSLSGGDAVLIVGVFVLISALMGFEYETPIDAVWNLAFCAVGWQIGGLFKWRMGTHPHFKYNSDGNLSGSEEEEDEEA